MPIAPPSHGARPKQQWSRDRAKTTTQRGYGAAWRKLRKIVIARDSGLCQVCLSSGFVKSFDEVDHITPKAKGGSDDLNNLQCICKPCHKAKTARHDSKG